MNTSNEEGQWEAFHSFSVELKALRNKPILKIGLLQTDKKLCFGAIPTLFRHVKHIVEIRNSRKSDEEGEVY
uniref:Uncharacterized protein n=1 Tax=Lepeophtheirus salmonis TaxID=72036 RepID=A0A0K2VFN8_LEPSM